MLDVTPQPESNSLLEKIALNLYAFMRQVGIKAQFGRTQGLGYGYEIVDLTEDGQVLAAKYELNLQTLAKYEIEDTPQSIEKFCYAITLDLGLQLLKAKAQRLLQYDEKQNSGLIVPG